MTRATWSGRHRSGGGEQLPPGPADTWPAQLVDERNAALQVALGWPTTPEQRELATRWQLRRHGG